MPTKNVTDERLSKFKNKGKDPAVSWRVIIYLFSSKGIHLNNFNNTTCLHLELLQKLREKRISECVELRKAHKNENFLKRRNITLSSLPDEEALSPDYISDEKVSSRKRHFLIWTSEASNNLSVI